MRASSMGLYCVFQAIYDWKYRSILALIGLHLFDTWGAKKVEAWKPLPLGNPNTSALPSIYRRLKLGSYLKEICITGWMAIVPRQSEEGDLPCYLKTALVPFMLWKKHNQRHALVGSCYFMALRMRYRNSRLANNCLRWNSCITF